MGARLDIAPRVAPCGKEGDLRAIELAMLIVRNFLFTPASTFLSVCHVGAHRRGVHQTPVETGRLFSAG